MSFANIKVSAKGLEEVQKKLKHIPQKINVVVSRAINSASDKARTHLVKTVRERFKIQPSRIRDTVQIHRATQSNPSARVVVRESRQPITRFQVSPKIPPALAGVKIKRRRRVRTSVSKNNKTTWQRAFLARFKSGYLGLMERTGGKTRTGAAKLKQHYGPAVPQMLGGKSGAQTIAEAAEKRLNSELDRQIDLALKE